MTIKSNISDPVTDLGAQSADTVLFDKTARTLITAFILHNLVEGEDREVFIYISPNSTSASGTRVEVLTLAPDEEMDVNSMLGQGLTGDEQVIAVQQTTGALLGEVVSKITYTEYTGGS